MNRVLYIILSLIFMFSHLNGQDEDKSFIQSDTIKVVKSTQVIGLPIAFYTPETNFGIGGGAQFIFNDMRNVFNSRLSDMIITAVYTSKNQLLLDARPQIHIYDGEFFLDGIFRFKLFPNSFWGIGNATLDENLEAYNMQSTEVQVSILKRIPNTVNFGFEYMFQHHKMLEYDSTGILYNEDIPGSAGATISSLNSVFTFDDRDNIFSARSGNFVKLKAGFCSRVLGSTHSYNKYIFDIRKYIRIGSSLSIAAQYYMEMTHGDVPFQQMAWLGGGEKTRGYFRGRYIDHQFYAAQVELRWRFAQRWILAGFVSGGDVSYQVSQLYEDVKHSYGGGLRYQLSKKSRTLVRLDIGIGRSGNSGVYFGVNEAF